MKTPGQLAGRFRFQSLLTILRIGFGALPVKRRERTVA